MRRKVNHDRRRKEPPFNRRKYGVCRAAQKNGATDLKNFACSGEYGIANDFGGDTDALLFRAAKATHIGDRRARKPFCERRKNVKLVEEMTAHIGTQP